MKILHVGKFYSPIEGGIESINKFIVDTLKGNSQRVICFNNRNKTVEDDIDDISVLRSASFGVIAKQPLSIRYFWDLRRTIKYYNPDVVHFHYPNPLIALYLLILIPSFTKLIVHWHSDIIAQKNFLAVVSPVEKKLLKRADKVIATSENYRDNSERLKSVTEKVVVIPCSIDESKFMLSDADKLKIQSLKNKYGKPIVLFVGRHVDYKGIRFLLEAERSISNDCVILIGGSGPLTNSLKEEFKSNRIEWLGRIPDDDMKIYYHAADIFAFPSITKNEAFGVVLAEAMYCENPTVTFTIEGSGVNWVAPNSEVSLEVENSNSESYAVAIDRLLSDEGLRRGLGKNGLKRTMKLFSKGVVGEQYKKLYKLLK